MTRQCCVCLRIWEKTPALRGGQWAPRGERVSSVTHTYCPSCLQAAMRQVERMRASRAAAVATAA